MTVTAPNMHVLGTSIQDGSVFATATGALGAFDGVNTPINAKLKALELGEPEGTLMEMVLILPAITIPLVGKTDYVADTMAAHIAAVLNAKYAAGTLEDPTTGERLERWPRPYSYPVAVASGNRVTLRWIKLQAFAFIMVGVLVAVLGYVLYRYLSGAGWSLSGSTTPGSKTMPGSSGPKIFGVGWGWWAAGIATAIVIPVGFWYVDSIDRHRADLAQDAHRMRQIREEDDRPWRPS